VRSGHLGKESPCSCCLSMSVLTLSTVVCGSNERPFSRRLSEAEGEGEEASLLLLLLLDKNTTRPTEAPAAIAMRGKGFMILLYATAGC